MQRPNSPGGEYTGMTSTDGKWERLSFQGTSYGLPDFSTPNSVGIHEATSSCVKSVETVNISTTELHIACTLPAVSSVDSSDSMRLHAGGYNFWAQLTSTNQITFFGNVGGVIHTFGPISYTTGAVYTQHYTLTEVKFLLNSVVKATFPIQSGYSLPSEFAKFGFFWGQLGSENQITFFGATGADDTGATYTQQYTSTGVNFLADGVVVATFPLNMSQSSDPEFANIGFFQEPLAPSLPISGKPTNTYVFGGLNMYMGGTGATGATGNSSGNTGINNMTAISYNASTNELLATGFDMIFTASYVLKPGQIWTSVLSATEVGLMVNGNSFELPGGTTFTLADTVGGTIKFTGYALGSQVFLNAAPYVIAGSGAGGGGGGGASGVDLALKYVYGDTATQDVKITVYGEQVPAIEADEEIVINLPLADLKGLLTFSEGATGSPEIDIEGEKLNYPNINLVPSAVLGSRKVGLKAALRSRVRAGVFADDGSNDVHTLSHHLFASTTYTDSLLDTSIPIAAIKKQDPQAVEIADLDAVIVPVAVAGGNSATLDDAKKVAVAALFEEAVAQGRVTLEDASPHLDLALGDSITLYVRYDLAQTRRYAADADVAVHSSATGAQTVSLTFGGKTFDITFNNSDDDAKEIGVGSKLYAFKFVASAAGSVFAA